MRTLSGFIFVGLAVFMGSFFFGNLLSVTLLREALPPAPAPAPMAVMESALLLAPAPGGGAARNASAQTATGRLAQTQTRPLATQASTSAPTRQTGPNVVLAASPIEDEVHAALASWVASIRTKDLPAHMGHYGPLLETYYGKQNVSWASIHKDKNRFLTAYRRVVEYRIGNVIVSPRSPDEAVVEFDRWWDFRTRDGQRFAGKELQQLVMRRIDGRLRIVSEENLTVHWIIRP